MLVIHGFFILCFSGGILSSKPPPPSSRPVPNCPINEHYTANDRRCQKTCANFDQEDCLCKPFTGCVCDAGFVRLNKDASGPCVQESCCHPKCRDRHAIFKKCPNPCPLTCDEPNPKPCAKMCLRTGCECAPGFILNKIGGRCIRPKDCPARRCPKNEHYVREDNQCQRTCGNRLLPGSEFAGACVPFTGCVCDHGYVRKYDDASGICIPESQCVPIPTQCGFNEEPTSCRIDCPSQTCDSIFTSYDCPEADCEPGCDCINDFLRNSDGVCIPSEKCFKVPECGPNEVASDCAFICPPQSCESLFTTYLCAASNCTPGCNCIDGFLRNSDGICIPSEQCFTEDCYGDVNATHVQCGSACRPTCDEPEPEICILICILNGCKCKQGFILSERDGVCIDPSDCPGGSPICAGNTTYVGCKVGCPTEYCPRDDSRAMIACSIAYPCDGGCACKPGYLIVSQDDPRCILASECPPVDCTRPNEVWDPNPSNCFLERCEDRGIECDFPYAATPRCVCKKGFFRNENDICIPESECPPLGCKGDANATLKQCPTPCPDTCADPKASSRPCIEICLPDGCVCNPGFILTEIGGVCIKLEDCPPEYGCNGDKNATRNDCPSACPTTCANLNNKDANLFCPTVCDPSGCECKPGFILTDIGGQCVNPEDCPPPGCNGDLNAMFSDCPSVCQTTCANLDIAVPCVPGCLPPGCICKPGYVLTEPDGICIEPSNCPAEPQCNGDRNATYRECPSACQSTCENPNASNGPCTRQCMPPGCVCKTGFILTEKGGTCIEPGDCPVVPSCNGDNNAIFSECPSACPLTCANKDDAERVCTAQCMPPGCVCKPGFVLGESGTCIKPEDCPVGCNGDPNATFRECTSACPLTCASREPRFCIAVCRPPGCVCNSGFVLSDNGKCVRPEDCPAQSQCNGDLNATYSECPSACQVTCDDRNDADGVCTEQCLPAGCICKPGFVLTQAGGICIKPEDCPAKQCGPNATFRDCTSACPLTCSDPEPRPCIAVCLPPGCECDYGFVLSDDGKCIKPEDCPADPQCNGDRNATYKECPSACQATCDSPNEIRPCIDMCMPPGCVCKQGFLLTESGGTCIRPGDCPGGSPTCGANETYVYCYVGCPTNYCPVDDSRAIVACDPMFPCPGGCACQGGYLKISETDERCILSSECPPVKCTRPNEVWSPDAPSCLPERCEERNIPCDFPYPVPPRCICKDGYFRNQDDICVPECECPPLGCNGDVNATFSECPSPCQATCEEPDTDVICITVCDEPGCVCNDGFILSGEICVNPYDCPGGSPTCPSNKTYTTCKFYCPSNYCPKGEDEGVVICDPVWPCPDSGCVCQPGYLMLDDIDNICVLAEDCPPVNCNKPNEVWDSRPPECDFERCEDILNDCSNAQPGRPRCVCKKGFYRNHDGVCVPAKECPKIECGYNEEYVHCRQICPPQNCEIAYTDYACGEETKICEPGCNCLPDHLRNGSGICIPNEECPYPSTPVCGINEIARDCRRICPPQTCMSKYALFRCQEDIPCEPGCDCIPNYLRDDSGVCIRSDKCPPLCPITEECKRTCTSPNPPNCEFTPSDENIDGCNCIDGYILSKVGGECIRIEDCPPDVGCDGDPNAAAKRCPLPCPSTCQAPNASPCKRMCDPIACACKPGFILSNDTNGRCILPEQCPGGNPCGNNSHYVDCNPDCPYNYCPVDDSRDIVFCDPPAPCLSGCVCDLNHRKKSQQDPRCIVSSDCPPVKCTRPNEVWDSCPYPCLAENCEDVNNQPTTCNTLVLNCQPACICKKNFFRNATGICIPAKDCPC